MVLRMRGAPSHECERPGRCEAPVWELESRAGRYHQPAKARRGRCHCPDFTAAFGGTTDIAEPAAGFGAVVNDPNVWSGRA